MKALQFSLKKQLEGASGPLNLTVEAEVPAGRVLAVMGPSGAGKTSLLRMLAGLMQADEGFIRLNGENWLDTSRSIEVVPQKRKVGYVFQQYGLFPHWSVRKNLAFAQEDSSNPREIEEWLARIQLTDLADRKPGQLSGGQQQRVALVRAMIRKPDLLLLDEPLAAQDQQLRKQLQVDLRQLLSEQPTTTILVSHDPQEVVRLADQVVCLANGKVAQRGTPEALFGLENGHLIRLEVIRHSPEGHPLVWLGGKLVQISTKENKAVGEWIEWPNPELGS